jgi:biopolymer transport protein ExbD
MNLRRRPAPRARIEIIPMIDVVFFLLVFFMMASLSMAVYHGMPVNLPQAASGQPTAPDTVAVTVDREGRTFLDREPVSIDALASRLRARIQGNPALATVVNADGDVVHRHVIDVLDAVRGAGVSKIAIAVTPATAAVRAGSPGR